MEPLGNFPYPVVIREMITTEYPHGYCMNFVTLAYLVVTFKKLVQGLMMGVKPSLLLMPPTPY